ncbi:MAG: hypothetical protein JWP36_187 [Paucimonas sp.]|nr:hypothetical protein [Paucimonas sp.]
MKLSLISAGIVVYALLAAAWIAFADSAAGLLMLRPPGY